MGKLMQKSKSWKNRAVSMNPSEYHFRMWPHTYDVTFISHALGTSSAAGGAKPHMHSIDCLAMTWIPSKSFRETYLIPPSDVSPQITAKGGGPSRWGPRCVLWIPIQGFPFDYVYFVLAWNREITPNNTTLAIIEIADKINKYVMRECA